MFKKGLDLLRQLRVLPLQLLVLGEEGSHLVVVAPQANVHSLLHELHRADLGRIGQNRLPLNRLTLIVGGTHAGKACCLVVFIDRWVTSARPLMKRL